MSDSRNDRWIRVKGIVADALDHDEKRRADFIAVACDGDEALRAQVGELLELEDQADVCFGKPVVSVETDVPHRIAGYEIRSVVASGGMGTVYEAVQAHPHRVVALKVLRRGMASSKALLRFRHEAEILGRLKHPNIAQIFDAGAFDEGEGQQPYFAMEYIEGRSLTRYADERELNVRQRLELLATVCDAVQYAHQRGIIHRDLKPDNILVDDSGQPKVLDFGVARATDSDIQMTTLRTDVGQLVGTVPYMSPDQVVGDSADLDSRSDVYALGVVIYQVLVGTLPYDLRRRTMPEAARIIREDEPRPMSSIDRTFRGDLDTIVAKALEKDRTRRYQSAAELAADIRHFLNDQPIIARPASAMYQLRKFTKRNKTLVGGIAAAFVLLLVGSGATTWQWFRVREEARRSNDVARYMMDFLALRKPGEEVTGRFEPAPAGGEAYTMEELIDRASRRLDDELLEWPAVRADLHFRFSRTYYGLRRRDDHLRHAKRAYELRLESLGPDHRDTYEAQSWYGRGLTKQQPDEALGHLQAAADGLARNYPTDRLIPLARCFLGGAIFESGRREEGLRMLREAWHAARDTLDTDDLITVRTLVNYGAYLRQAGKHAEAEAALHSGLDGALSMPRGDHHAAGLLNGLARSLQLQMKLEQAKGICELGIDWTRRDGAPGLDRSALSMAFVMCGILDDTGQTDEAKRIAWRTYEECRIHLGVHRHTLWCLDRLREHDPASQRTLRAMHALAWQIKDHAHAPERLPDAERIADEARRTALEALGSGDELTAVMIDTHAVMLHQLDRNEEAAPLFRQANAVAHEVVGEPDCYTLVSSADFARCLIELGEYAEAETLVLASLNGLGDMDRLEEETEAKLRGCLHDIHDLEGRSGDQEAR